MNLDSMYSEVILDHYRTPHGKGLREPFSAEVHHVNPTCGDEVTLRVRIEPDSGGDAVIVDMSYDSAGCSISQASTSILYDQVTGQHVAEAFRRFESFRSLMHSATEAGRDAEIDEVALGDAIALEGVAQYPARIKCALLSWMALYEATNEALAAQTTTEDGDS